MACVCRAHAHAPDKLFVAALSACHVQVRDVAVCPGSDARKVMTLVIQANSPTASAAGSNAAGFPLCEVYTTDLTAAATDEALRAVCSKLAELAPETTMALPKHKGLPVPRKLLPDVVVIDDDSVNQKALLQVFNNCRCVHWVRACFACARSVTATASALCNARLSLPL